MICPCMKCTERHSLCHATCERYKEFQAEREIERGKRLERIRTYRPETPALLRNKKRRATR